MRRMALDAHRLPRRTGLSQHSGIRGRTLIVSTVVGALGTAGLGGVVATASPTWATVPMVAAPGAVFVANYGGGGSSGIEASGSVSSFRAGAEGDAHPFSTISAKINAPQGLTFDSSGDLWVTSSNANTVLEYAKSQLAKATPVPGVVLSSDKLGSLNGPGSLVFDPSGDLWVANTSVSTVVEYAKNQLAESGSPTPVATISNDSFNAPYGVAIDPSGDLWVSDNAQPGSPAVFEYAKSQLTKAAPTPKRTLSLPLNPIGDDTRSGLAFDSGGDLWVVNSSANSLVEFSRNELTKASSTPSVTIFSKAISLNSPDDLAFDPSGDMWVANTGGNTVVEYSKSQLTRSGSPKPVRTISGPATGLNYPMGVAVEPAAPRT
jgi:DNA-binding beta-propeller fold protein YncE